MFGNVSSNHQDENISIMEEGNLGRWFNIDRNDKLSTNPKELRYKTKEEWPWIYIKRKSCVCKWVFNSKRSDSVTPSCGDSQWFTILLASSVQYLLEEEDTSRKPPSSTPTVHMDKSYCLLLDHRSGLVLFFPCLDQKKKSCMFIYGIYLQR